MLTLIEEPVDADLLLAEVAGGVTDLLPLRSSISSLSRTISERRGGDLDREGERTWRR